MRRHHHSRLYLVDRRHKISSSRNGVERSDAKTVAENPVARFDALHLDHG